MMSDYNLKSAIAMSLGHIRESNFVSKTVATATTPSTAERVRKSLDSGVACDHSEEVDKVLEFIVSEHRNEFLSDARNALSNYSYDLGRYIPLDTISAGKISFVAPVVSNFLRSSKNKLDEESLKNLDYIGTLKEKGEFFVKLVKIIEKGDYKIHRIVDRNGNRGFFYNFNGSEINVNECFLMKATVARHTVSTYDSGKDTYFNRVMIVSNHGSKNEEEKVDSGIKSTFRDRFNKDNKKWQDILAAEGKE
tara:strand:+ start:256 stop:1005 length:750 start_codon:yes stop_codon:yes gene_type:complete